VITVRSFKPGTPHRALAEWLDAWRMQDWDAMVVASQPHWRKGHKDPRGALVTGCRDLWLMDYAISKNHKPPLRIVNTLAVVPEMPAFILFVDLSVRVRYQFMDGARPVREVSTRIFARLVREHSDGTPAAADDAAASWYVNPVSMMREHAGRTHVRTLAAAPA